MIDISNKNIIEINGEKYIKMSCVPAMPPLGDKVIVRTYSAGVHVGNLDEKWNHDGQVITLKDTRRIWRWKGPKTLNGIAMRGVDREEYTRISKPVAEIQLVPIECIPVAKAIDLSEIWND